MPNILLCDDHLIFAESLACLLSRKGACIVAVTGDLDEAIGVLARGSVDVALLDIQFTGESLLDRIAAVRGAAPSTRLVALTGHIDGETVAAARAGGVTGFVDKRQSSSVIMSTIERVIAGEIVLPPGQSVPTAGPAPEALDAQRLTNFLTPRERQALCLLVAGYDTARLARTFGVTQATARSHVQSMLIKMNVHSRLEAATMAVRCGIVDPATGTWLL